MPRKESFEKLIVEEVKLSKKTQCHRYRRPIHGYKGSGCEERNKESKITLSVESEVVGREGYIFSDSGYIGDLKA